MSITLQAQLRVSLTLSPTRRSTRRGVGMAIFAALTAVLALPSAPPIEQLIKHALATHSHNSSALLAPNNICDPKGPNEYACCARLYLNDSIFHINDTACAEVSYDTGTEDIDLAITLNGKDIFDDKIDLHDFQKECVGIPYLKKDAEICVDFDKILLNTTYIGACVRPLSRALHCTKIDPDARFCN